MTIDAPARHAPPRREITLAPPTRAAHRARMFDDLRAIDIFIAARRLAGITVRTPLRRSPALSQRTGGDVYLKLECDQVTGSFKLRGAYNALAALPDDVRARGVAASSAGNHGLGVAWAAKQLNIPATVFVPQAAPNVKRRGIEKLGATVDAESRDYDEAMVRAKAFAHDHGLTFINPCLGDTLIAGQGTVALEIVEELPDLQMVVTPVGGGGLLAGTGSLLRRVAPAVVIAGAQSVNTAAMSRSLAVGHVTPIRGVPTLADGLAGDIDEFAFDIGRKTIDHIAVVDEASIAEAIRFLAEEEQLVVEGAGAVGVAAILDEKLELHFPCVIIVSGRNIDPERYAEIVGAPTA
jgi:threonine dehydratase